MNTTVFLVPLQFLKQSLNQLFDDQEPWQISTITAISVFISVWVYQFLFQEDEDIITRCRKTFYKLIKTIPSIRGKLQNQLIECNEKFIKKSANLMSNTTIFRTIPFEGLSPHNILKYAQKNINLGQFEWPNGKVSGTVYCNNPDLRNMVKEIYAIAAYTNPMHSDIFPGLCKMEAEVVQMCLKLFHGNEGSCGTMTTGGTESILMACKAYRDFGREKKGIKHPEMVLPVTAHSAFDKAAQYFKIKIRNIPVDMKTYQVDIKAMKRAIGRNTVMLVGSAPNFPYGTMDDIGSISRLGIKYNIPVHVDSCLGGFLTPFMERAGYTIPYSDFRLPGVTSISADTHKYGFAPKGTSLIMYSSKKYLHHQYTKTTDWPGGVYGSPTVNGSRAGGAIAACCATLLYFGIEGYVNATKEIINTTKQIEKCLREIKEIFIFGRPVTSVIAISSHVFHIYRLQSYLSRKGWNLKVLQYPSALHICVTSVHTSAGIADQFVNDVKAGVAEIMKNAEKPIEGMLAIYGASQNLPDRGIVGEILNEYLDAAYYLPPDVSNYFNINYERE